MKNPPQTARVDVASLIASLNEQRLAQGLSWRTLAYQAGVSPSSLTRMQQGKMPDVNTFAALINWLGVAAEHFMTGETTRSPEDSHPLVMASALLKGKREMSPEVQEALEALVRAAFTLSERLRLGGE